ncbi:amino acid ABC transporter permease [Streptomyces sp. SID3343]|uniref:amino acid ABC transporter permease n=1 Tax=Streptomyces sp. SID3343 TaxID=2690260 RepID=UPI00136A81A6|nr:amino acid ABC transporter permease [Streptomyces sp. SID3343]MYW02072.1 ABC transporter permease subunit [Streptomyces sp. SID3343]
MSREASVLFDVPGPKARMRNLIVGIVGTLALAGFVIFVIVRFNETGQFESAKWDPFQYSGVQQFILDGLKATLKAFAYAAVLSILLGALLAAGRLSDHAPVRWAATAFVTFFRAMPLLVLIFMLYLIPGSMGWWKWDPLWPLVVGLTVYNGTVQAENIRAGILAVPKGQSEAAYALGMRKTQVMTMILVPQGIRTMLPTIISQVVVTLKDTSLGFLITYPELLAAAKLIGGYQDYNMPFIPVTLIIGAIYISMCMILSAFATWLERRLRTSRKGKPPAAPAQADMGGGYGRSTATLPAAVGPSA